MAPYTVLISGANRGIGKGLLELYLARPNHVVIAANRNPDHETSKALADLPKGPGSSLIVVKVDATAASDAAAAVKQLEEVHGIRHLDLVIANAGISYCWPKVSEVKREDMQAHIEPNVYGLVWLYQATLPLLVKAANPKWVSVGSCSAYLTVRLEQLDMPNAAYAPSKVIVHWLTKAIHREEPALVAFPLDPGWVQTDLGNTGAHAFGHESAPLKVSDVCAGTLKVIDAATRETHGGRLIRYDGVELPW
ncbi:short chain dehydrogenase [Hirsutella rhossiliensis]|uniref:Short chain dehydrogenase domain-containing protein n=1 Tax=Hirsutella rhossiliensis TaxID=111463 RepID=A0A9P8MNS9_9HYPO|nr:short chain dehydrogenase domain-containing protein [Hirsutella rhossiliensis]KAH0957416.1 short chain dehydrogenase domain-containing protein [Hirsutella rhossiliensis]